MFLHSTPPLSRRLTLEILLFSYAWRPQGLPLHFVSVQGLKCSGDPCGRQDNSQALQSPRPLDYRSAVAPVPPATTSTMSPRRRASARTINGKEQLNSI